MAVAFDDAVLRLRKRAGEYWPDFVKDFEQYSNEIAIQVAHAPADQVLIMQGRARQCFALLQKFKDVTAK